MLRCCAAISEYLLVATFAPYALGAEFTLADCAMACHVPLVALVTKAVLGRDCFDGMPQIPEYLQRVCERPAVMLHCIP